MPAKNFDLHGFVPDSSPVALLLIDVINDLGFPEGRRLLAHALPAARRIARLKRRCRAHGIPAIYVNDNFGRWRSDLPSLVRHGLGGRSLGAPIVRLLRPGRSDYFVLKPKHSGFFSTALDLLLQYLSVRTVIVAGFAGNICVLYTANDAYMRDFELLVPADCCASNEKADNDHALRQMRTSLKADIRVSADIDLAALVRRRGARRRAAPSR